MPLNYRKNSVTCTTEYYQNVSDLNGPGICSGNRINIRTYGSTQYIGLVAPGHSQASDLSVRVGSNNLRMAKLSKFTTCSFSWGNGTLSQLGNGTVTSSCVPRSVSCEPFYIIDSSDIYALALKADGSAWGWGNNSSGQLGNGTITNSCVPVSVCGGHIFCAINAGFTHSLALKADGSAWAWGNNFCGALGNGTITNSCVPVTVCGGHIFCAISAGLNYSLALKADGSAWAWGNNSCGQLGGVIGSQCIPVQVCGGHIFCAISAGFNHSLSLKADGSAWGWGFNGFGQLGDGTVTTRFAPVAVCGGNIFCAISAGYSHSLALKADGSALAWGFNGSGQLGNGISGTGANRCVPVSVCGGHIFCVINAVGGSAHSLALKADGSAWAWGFNSCGQLGNGTITNSCVPVTVCGGNIFCTIIGGTNVSYAISCHWLSPDTVQGLSYSSDYFIVRTFSSILYSPTLSNSGSSTLTYSISPSLPSGLSFNTSNGQISGSTALINDTNYTITVSNSTSSTFTNIRIRTVHLNTIMYPQTAYTNEGYTYSGYMRNWYEDAGDIGNLDSNSFRSNNIIALYAQAFNGLVAVGFVTSGQYNNNNSDSFTKIIWNGVTYLRSSFQSYSVSSDPSYTFWQFYQNNVPPVVVPPMPYNIDIPPSSVSLIIE